MNDFPAAPRDDDLSGRPSDKVIKALKDAEYAPELDERLEDLLTDLGSIDLERYARVISGVRNMLEPVQGDPEIRDQLDAFLRKYAARDMRLVDDREGGFDVYALNTSVGDETIGSVALDAAERDV